MKRFKVQVVQQREAWITVAANTHKEACLKVDEQIHCDDAVEPAWTVTSLEAEYAEEVEVD